MQVAVQQKFASYPAPIRAALMGIRQAIYDTALADGIETITETLKWQQPSYLNKHGSTIRLGWSSKMPKQYCVFFNCKTLLVETFKELYRDEFNYQGNRAIVFEVSDSVPLAELKQCLSMSLRYHKIKHLPLLGGG